jgi:hypothetical protein
MASSGIAALKAHLSGHSDLDAATVRRLLSTCWDDLRGGHETKMDASKLWRIEEPSWQPPFLEFWIERHGQTVNGSTRATAYKWRVNLDALTAKIVEEKRRQLYSMDKRLDVKPIAESLAKAIIKGHCDDRLKVGRDGSVRLNVSLIIPETFQQTTAARRKRLRRHLDELLKPYGWEQIRLYVYAHVGRSHDA